MLRKSKGQTLIEYALLIALIALAVIAAINTLGQKVNTAFTNAGNAMTPVAPAP